MLLLKGSDYNFPMKINKVGHRLLVKMTKYQKMLGLDYKLKKLCKQKKI
jgi:hypothetical protein